MRRRPGHHRDHARPEASPRPRRLPLTATLVLGGCSSDEGTDPSGATSASPSSPAPQSDGGQPKKGASALTFDVNAFADRVDDEGVIVLDVRTPEEFAQGHLPGAVNIDVSAPDFQERIEELDKDAPIAVYCRSGNRSALAMGLMSGRGFTDLAHLEGGISAWQDAGHEVVTD